MFNLLQIVTALLVAIAMSLALADALELPISPTEEAGKYSAIATVQTL